MILIPIFSPSYLQKRNNTKYGVTSNKYITNDIYFLTYLCVIIFLCGIQSVTLYVPYKIIHSDKALPWDGPTVSM